MNFSTFCQKFYNDSKTIQRIGSQHKFISELFHACGSHYFPKNIKKDDNESKFWSARALYSGRRNLTIDMKESLLYQANEEKFVLHFANRVPEGSVKKISENFEIFESNINKYVLLRALYRQFLIIVNEESDRNIVVEEYKKLLKNPDASVDNVSVTALDTNGNFIQAKAEYNDSSKQLPVRLWLPDAELATEEQAGFGSFTSTVSSADFTNPDSGVCGIRSAKGVGKTYLLQKMRRDLNNYAIPHYHKLSKDNEWGTESVRFDDASLLENADLEQLAGLWKVSILCLVINSIEDTDKPRTSAKSKLLDKIAYILGDADLFNNLNMIINEILSDSNWRATIKYNYTILRKVCMRAIKSRGENAEDRIVIFIDKTDQSVLQPGAEIPECNNCYKDTGYDRCSKGHDDINYCLQECRGCCIGCEKFSSQYAGEELRIYGVRYGKRYEHISQWQHLQLALVLAVNSIRLDFRSQIEVYYAIRQEAFNAEENLLGANASKIKAHTAILHYSKEEQEEIFNNTIRIQNPYYLYNPSLISKGKYSEAFVGIGKLCHPYVKGKSESLFECIYRHSFDRAREIQYIGDALAMNVSKLKKMETREEREEQVKKIIETTSANLLFQTSGNTTSGNRTYYNDKQILLRNYWANPDNFKNFIQEIDRNLLFMDDLSSICKKINKYPNCNNNCKETNCEHHPFSMLYQIGLLGRASYNSNINKDGEQVFIDSKDITYYRDKAEIFPNNETLYILHPALTKCIEKNIRGSSIMHFCGFILGKGLLVPRDIHRELLINKKNMDAKSFEAKYYSQFSPIISF